MTKLKKCCKFLLEGNIDKTWPMVCAACGTTHEFKMKEEKLIKDFVMFMKLNMNLMLTISGQTDDTKGIFTFLDQQVILFMEKTNK